MRIILANCPTCGEINAPLGRLSNSSACFNCRCCGDTWTQYLTDEQKGGDIFLVTTPEQEAIKNGTME